jgi:hypothetical protein
MVGWILAISGALGIAGWCAFVGYGLVELLSEEAAIHADYLRQLRGLAMVLGGVLLQDVRIVVVTLGGAAAPLLIFGVVTLAVSRRLRRAPA